MLQVYKTGVDEWLKLCQLFEPLVRQYCKKAPPPMHKTKASKSSKAATQQKALKSADKLKAAVESIGGVRLGDSAKRGKTGESRGAKRSQKHTVQVKAC